MPFRAAELKKKLVAGLASLYDPVEERTLESPIYKHNSMEVPPPNHIVDLCSSEHTSPPEDMIIDLTRSEDQIEDGMDVDEEAAAVKRIQNEWV